MQWLNMKGKQLENGEFSYLGSDYSLLKGRGLLSVDAGRVYSQV